MDNKKHDLHFWARDFQYNFISMIRDFTICIVDIKPSNSLNVLYFSSSGIITIEQQELSLNKREKEK